MFKFSKNPEGFTLVELMVVVAIIGILSAIAVPNFKKYQAKSKQSEAKIQLAAIYNAEVGSSADWDTYATCLADLGYEVSPKGYYVVGFATAGTAHATITTRGGTCSSSKDLTPALLLNGGGAAAAVADLPASIADQNTFTAGAAGNITNSSAKDKWTITQAKTLLNSTPGY